MTVEEGAVNIGANPSAEEQEEALDDSAQKVNNIIHSFRFQSTTFDKKQYVTYIKGYLKRLKAHLQTEKKESEENVSKFEQGAAAHVKKVIANFKGRCYNM